MVQYNFKIEDQLKARLEKALEESGAENKSDFLEQMVSAYIVHQSNTVNANIDLSKYENVNEQTKEVMNNAFRHILTTLDGNFSNTKQEAIYLDVERKALTEKEEVYKNKIFKLKADTNTEIEAVKTEASKLFSDAKETAEHLSSKLQTLKASKEALEKEFANVSKVADQVQFITNENKELREVNRTGEALAKNKETELLNQIKSITGELTSAKEVSLKEEIESKNKDKEIKALKDQLAQMIKTSDKSISSLKAEHKAETEILNKELLDARSELNKSIGKLEILQTS